MQDHLDELFQPTLVELGGIVYREVGCNQPSNKYFTFDFGSNKVRFSYKDAVSRQGNKCYLGFTYHNGMQILGDIFLRQAYVYFDLSGKTVSIAQAKYTKSSNVIVAWAHQQAGCILVTGDSLLNNVEKNIRVKHWNYGQNH